jgi:hypothetical protein
MMTGPCIPLSNIPNWDSNSNRESGDKAMPAPDLHVLDEEIEKVNAQIVTLLNRQHFLSKVRASLLGAEDRNVEIDPDGGESAEQSSGAADRQLLERQ